jgi:hypothetical protein
VAATAMGPPGIRNAEFGMNGHEIERSIPNSAFLIPN